MPFLFVLQKFTRTFLAKWKILYLQSDEQAIVCSSIYSTH